MSLKDEISKLIQAEREKLQDKEEFHERQQRRFTTMRTVLSEIAESIDAKYLNADLRDSWAIIEVGKLSRSGDVWETDISWHIEPNFRSGGVKRPLIDMPGFMVEETMTVRNPEYETIEQRRAFKSESEVAEYLLPKIAEQVAFYQHLKDRQG